MIPILAALIINFCFNHIASLYNFYDKFGQWKSLATTITSILLHKKQYVPVTEFEKYSGMFVNKEKY